LFTNALTVRDAENTGPSATSGVARLDFAVARGRAQCAAFYEKFLMQRDSISNPARHFGLPETKGLKQHYVVTFPRRP
jgi:hypothetical protein